jgi:hypothetical protein
VWLTCGRWTRNGIGWCWLAASEKMETPWAGQGRGCSKHLRRLGIVDKLRASKDSRLSYTRTSSN